MKVNVPIRLLSQISLSKYKFINEELWPAATTTFTCPVCSGDVAIEIVPYQTGFDFQALHKSGYLTGDQIVRANLAKESSSKFNYLGKYLVVSLPTLYFVQVCPSCKEKYLVVAGCGEKQPGLWLCQISGVWNIEEQ